MRYKIFQALFLVVIFFSFITITAKAQNTLTVSSPTANQVWPLGSTQTISWTTDQNNSNSTQNQMVDIDLLPVNSCVNSNATSSCSSGSQVAPYIIALNAQANNNSYTWTVPSSLPQTYLGQDTVDVSYADSSARGVSQQVLVGGSNSNASTSASTSPVTATSTQGSTASTTATSTLPTITGLNPSSGPVGATVNILGSGFSATGNTVLFGTGTYIGNLPSTNGTAIQFTVPSYTQPCPPNNPGVCPYATAIITPGAYGVSVTNATGTASNIVPFQVSTGTGVSITPTPTPPATSVQSPSSFANGALLIVPGNPTVYWFNNATLEPFSNAQTFLAYGYQWNQIQTITQGDLNSQPISPTPVPVPAGSIIEAAGDTNIYLVTSGQKSLVPSMDVLNRLGLDIHKLIILSEQEVQSYPTAAPQQ